MKLIHLVCHVRAQLHYSLRAEWCEGVLGQPVVRASRVLGRRQVRGADGRAAGEAGEVLQGGQEAGAAAAEAGGLVSSDASGRVWAAPDLAWHGAWQGV